MSVLIRGIQTPKNCGVCPLRGCGYLCCPDTENERLIRTEYMCSDDLKRPDWCPITDLGSHGDLIDRDALSLRGKLKLIEEAEIQIYGGASWRFVGKCITAIEDAPTIIEAEGAEEVTK